MAVKTINCRLSWAEFKVADDGHVVLEIGAFTPGGQSLKIVLLMGPSTIGYIAETAHTAVKKLQETLDRVKARLRGDD